MNQNIKNLFLFIISLPAFWLILSCAQNSKADNTSAHRVVFAAGTGIPLDGPPGMVWIPGGEFIMGTDTDPQRRTDESPAHRVTIDGFWMDITEVTNAQFAEFVNATGYITTSETPIDWEELKKQVPPGTPRPADEMLQPASMVFTKTSGAVDLNNYMLWWSFVPGADWRHPQGPESSVGSIGNYPVVQVSWDDAMAYCKWAGKQLPTEAEWEFAARGGMADAVYPWGNDKDLAKHTNSWQGHFPDINTKEDGYETTAPVKSFAPNGYGLYDMAGNVWEWCSDFYRDDYYTMCASAASITYNPTGPGSPYDPNQPYNVVRVKRGGSFLCNDVYCASYRITARMATSFDTGQDHSGFRCVMTQDMWEEMKKKNE